MFDFLQTQVLIAEPAGPHARALIEAVERVGWPVRWAGDEQTAMALLRKEIFQAAVVAVEMTWSGQSALARLAQVPSIRRVVSMGCGGGVRMSRQAYADGAHAHLIRPVSADALAAALHAEPPTPVEALSVAPRLAVAGTVVRMVERSSAYG